MISDYLPNAEGLNHGLSELPLSSYFPVLQGFGDHWKHERDGAGRVQRTRQWLNQSFILMGGSDQLPMAPSHSRLRESLLDEQLKLINPRVCW
jgi:hypothetical protein